ncbi:MULTISPECIES: acetylornithine transaminase [unclassified Leifsonia]|uniref:acetylornithine transaminase n=1 Tax=unclassified Leifsonia TaxID=2663824 RepID=UPI002E0E8F6C|nr:MULTISPECIES: acetylornithine transaminase [unclassified Leifsonia]
MATPLGMLDRGDGCWVWDMDGMSYLDFLAGIAVNSLGHAHPVFVEAVSAQAARLAHVSNYFATEPQVALAERLKRLTGAGERGRVYFGNSGAEANEAAFKLARLHSSPSSSPPRTRIITLTDSFHGRTMGGLALSGKPAMRADFQPVPGGVEHIDPTLEALERAVDGTVAALFVEPILGEAGVRPLPDGFLERARELTTQHGALLIIDEIQTGAGRTGRWFGFQHAGIVPDAVTLAKGIGGGFPIGALVTYGDASELFGPGQHGSTFGGNPLATATSNAVLEEIESAGLVANAELRGQELRAAIMGIGSTLVTGVRGAGLLLGIALSEPVASEVVAAALREGLIINAPNPRSIRLAPPLIIGDSEIAEFTARFTRALQSVRPAKETS